MGVERLEFVGREGQTLAGRLETPDGPVQATAVFAHCFTCGKDIGAARRIAKNLTTEGFAVLRFDFTGLGHSGGEFGNTNFSSNVDDLVAAANHMKTMGMSADLLIGHSLGGAAVLAAAEQLPDVKAVATIGAPADPGHVMHLFEHAREMIEAAGEAEVCLVGRFFTIKKQFIDDISEQNQKARIANLRRPLLVFHSPTDDTVGVDNAAAIFKAAKHPKSFVSLADADHLLSEPADAAYVAAVLAAWASRYIEHRAPGMPNMAPDSIPAGTVAN